MCVCMYAHFCVYYVYARAHMCLPVRVKRFFVALDKVMDSDKFAPMP
jgi:hypothetical protein